MKKFFFINQSGWKQIVLPTGEVIDITSCDDGCYITTKDDMNEVVQKLNKFPNTPIIDIDCDHNEIGHNTIFKNAYITEHVDNLYAYKAICVVEDNVRQ